MKKIVYVFLLFSLFSISANGEEPRSNFLYGGINLLFLHSPEGWNIGYEYSVNNMFSFSFEVGRFIDFTPYVTTSVRWYPFSNIFFFGLGPGSWIYPIPNFFVSGGFGLRIIFGTQRRWVFMPNLISQIQIVPFNPLMGLLLKTGFSFGYMW